MHTHLFAEGWLPHAFYHGVARFITHDFAKKGVYETNETVGDGLVQATADPEGTLLIKEMDEAGIDMSVVFPVDFGLALGDPQTPIAAVNEKIAAIAAGHSDRLIAFSTVDPRREGACDLFCKCIEKWDMKGLKLHPCAGFYPNQKEVYPLLEQANQWKIPVLTHTGNMMYPLRSKYSQVVHLDDIAVDFPDLPIIAAHAGGTFGYPRIISLMSIKLNIMADISAWQTLALKNRTVFCRSLRELIDFTDPDRIFFGSDSPSFRSMMSNADWVNLIRNLPKCSPETIPFTEKEVTAILGNNARKLLKI